VVGLTYPIFPPSAAIQDSALHSRLYGNSCDGNATLFVYEEASTQFVRRTNSVKKENGDRAVGTQLAPDHPDLVRGSTRSAAGHEELLDDLRPPTIR
jgi:hypothetical protein